MPKEFVTGEMNGPEKPEKASLKKIYLKSVG